MYGSSERKVLPPELQSKRVVMLTCSSSAPGGFCDVYLVGTLHNSRKSSRYVGDVIKFLQPQVVFLELCSRRHDVIYKDRSEFNAAYKETSIYGGKVVFGDRPHKITMKRTWAKMPLHHKALLFPFYHLYKLLSRSKTFNRLVDQLAEESDDDDDDDDDGCEALQSLSRFPTVLETVVHERDQYMSAKLLEIAQMHNSVVAVVGKVHLTGIRENWKQPVDMEELVRKRPTIKKIPC